MINVPELVTRYCWEDPKAADRFMLVEPVTVSLTDGRVVTIPVGYKTDFASVPPILWGVFPSIGRHNLGSVVHDYMYDNRLFEAQMGEKEARKFADSQFLYFANLIGPKHKVRHYIMYRMVRWFGRKAWIN